MAKVFYKASVAGVLDYKFDFLALTHAEPGAVSDYLEVGETISSHVVTVETGITKDSDAITDTNTSVTVWLSGGTFGDKYTITCEIVTSAGRTDTFEATLILGVSR